MTHRDSPAPPPTIPPRQGSGGQDPADAPTDRATGLDPEPTSDPVDDPAPHIYVRFVLLPAVPNTDQGDFERALVVWVASKGHSIELAIAFVNRMSNQHLLINDVRKIVRAVELLPKNTDQALVIELMTGGAFTRRELRDPKQITAYCAHPDWTEIVATWRASRLPTIGQVIQGIEADRRRKAKQTTAPPPATTGNGRGGTRDELVSQLKTLLPRNLRNWAPDLAEAVRALAAATGTRMDAAVLAAAVRRRRAGTGTKVCDRVIASGLPHLMQHGYVIIEGDKARICPGKLS